MPFSVFVVHCLFLPRRQPAAIATEEAFIAPLTARKPCPRPVGGFPQGFEHHRGCSRK
ncbi:protein of unknown function [Paraburkholderia dioscoreae]|uniref:Uncharacterized protein n=1 Tax=Paraburkholderia dioscoreae TaxID=2604047 RepID=A0A5Q4ZHI0_9BURK|nr:protein of unknown function [Paraburkholderia dioscoreae]